MNKFYLFLYNDVVGSKEQVKDFIDGRPEIVNWRSELPNSFYLVSPNSAQELAAIVRIFTEDKGLFLIAECAEDRQGWLHPDSWKFFNEKRPPE